MGEGPLVMMGLLAIGLVFGGAISGIVAVVRTAGIRSDLNYQAKRLAELERRLREKPGDAPAAPMAWLSDAAAARSAHAPTPTPETAETPVPRATSATPAGPPAPPPLSSVSAGPPPLPVAAKTAQAATPPARPPSTPPPPPSSRPPVLARTESENTFEVMLGTKWLGWVGALLVLGGTAFFLKWAYERQLIPPEGRLAIGALGGVAALGLGEHFRRKQWTSLFQTLTGIGIAVFYLCIYFSFHIYNVTGQSVSFGMAALVTLLAVVMAVAHDALPIAILGVIGGFLSPVLFSAGGNHPYGLFSYVILIDLVALGAAFYRRWRALDLLSFLGTIALYQSWYSRYYNPVDQMLPALLFATIFYVLFLAIPTLYGLTRRVPERIEGLTLIAVNSLFSLCAYYNVLYRDYRYALGFVVIAQALLVFGLCRLWMVRVGRDSRTARSLLVIALGLVTLAIPIQLRLYGVPIAWAAESVVFVWLGFRYAEPIVRIGGAAALLLAACGLAVRLPLHRLPFTPIFNVPFGSWGLVIAAAAGASYLFWKGAARTFEASESTRWQAPDSAFALLAFFEAFVLGALLLSMECALFWSTRRMDNYVNYEFDSLVVLWSLIPMGTLWVVKTKHLPQAAPLAYVCFGVGAWMFLVGLGNYDHPTAALAMNATFLSKLVFVGALWWAAWVIPKVGLEQYGRETSLVFEVAGNVVLTVLLAFEFDRWSDHTDLISRRMGLALISAAWAAQAFTLIWVGLWMRKKPLRVLGFLLFGLTCVKVLFIDTRELEQIYRIVSFMATGVLLLLATWMYHRYSAALLGPVEPPETPVEQPKDGGV